MLISCNLQPGTRHKLSNLPDNVVFILKAGGRKYRTITYLKAGTKNHQTRPAMDLKAVKEVRIGNWKRVTVI